MQVLGRDDAIRFVESHDAVLDAPGNPRNPFASSAWLSHFIRQVVGPGTSVVALGSGGPLMLLQRDESMPGRWSALANYYASLYSPLSTGSDDRLGGLSSLCAEISAVRPRVTTLNLSPLDADAADTAALVRELSARGWYIRRYFCFGNWYLPCGDLDFQRYWASRDSQLRNTFQRKAKKLLAAGSVEIVARPQDVDAAMDAFDSVYAKSWKKPEPYPGFVRGWAKQCAENGWLRLGIARVEGQPVAAQFWFTVDRHAYIFKLAYDEEHAKWSAGTVLSAQLFRHALDVDRVVEVDYLTGDDPYKKVWVSHRRERIGLMACNLRTVGGIGAAAREWAGEARGRVRSALEARRA